MKFNEKERRRTMKARFLMLLPVTLFAALAMPVGLAAQEKKDPMRHHYKLVDLGTLGALRAPLPWVDRSTTREP